MHGPCSVRAELFCHMKNKYGAKQPTKQLCSNVLGGCPFNGPLSVMKYPTRESPRRDAVSPIKYNGLRVPQPSSLAEQQPVGR